MKGRGGRKEGDARERLLCQQDAWPGLGPDGGEEPVWDAGRAGEDLHAAERTHGRRPPAGMHGVVQAREDVHLLCGADTRIVHQAYPRHQTGTDEGLSVDGVHPGGDADHPLH